MIDWESGKTHVFLNPRLGEEEKSLIRQALPVNGDFASHIWVASSGTTGGVKFVALSKEAMLVSAEAVNKHIGSYSEDIWLHALPDFHVGGLAIWARGYLAGAKVVKYRGRWDAAKYAAQAQMAEATLSSLVPAQVFDLACLGIQSPPSLRTLFVGGGAITGALYKRIRALGWRIVPTYGFTECASQVATGSVENRCLSPLKHVEVVIDKEGYIQVKSAALFSTYAYFKRGKICLINPKRREWFKTEDRGEIIGGFLRIRGRSKNYLKIGGEGVNFNHLRKLWRRICSREGTTLIAAKDERLESVIHLLVRCDPSEIEREVEEYNRQVLPFAAIRKIVRV